ncbi:hypothetical protein Ahy_B06g081541 [Arachis hypogaea]|uniref:CCHC-type domain-containing protein n=1 Tax=Arachis hypogaea TaxID=3818 RepID=A0A444YL99_ARAHY|nr:hypothetical protein Ahy_B06g081541 [Arachis hypogaea]
MFHHGGNFEKDDEGKLRYTPDNLTCLGDLDEDTLDIFFIRNYYKELGYDKILHCWWLVPGRTLETGLRNLNSDNELREMCFLAHKNNGLVDVYFEHGVSSPDYLQDEEEKAGMDAKEEGAMVTPNDKVRNPNSESPQDKATPVNTIDIPNPQINPTPPSNPTPLTMPESVTNPKPPSQEKPLPNPNDQSQAKPATYQKPKPPTNPQPKPPTNQFAKPPTNPQPKPPTHQKPKPPTTSKSKPPTKPILPKSVPTATSNSTLKSTLKKKTTTTTPNFRPCTRSVAKGKAVLQAGQEGGDALWSDSYDSDEDSLYEPRIEDSSSSDDDDYDNDVCKAKTIKEDINFKHSPAAAFAKDKEQVMSEDDAFVEEVSDGDVDLGFVGGTGDDAYNAYDPGADSDGANSWHSEEMKTPPNSEDEGADEESEDFCPVFREGIRFGELQMEVGMKFNTKWDFKEAVREFTIQEGRRIRFRKNDNVRMRATCQTFWEVSESLKPQPPKIKRGPGKLQQKRRIGTDEAKGGSKKSKPTSTKDNTNLKRQLAPFTCSYCGEKGHTKRGCKKKKLADAAAKAKAAAAAQAKAAAAAQAKAAAKNTTRAETNVVEDGQNAAKPDPNAEPDPNATDDANVGKDAPADDDDTNVQPVEVDLSQPIYSEPEESQQATEVCTITKSRPDKLPPKRKSSVSPTSAHEPVNPMQGASSGTAARLGSILKFIPTPGFKAPRKKN